MISAGVPRLGITPCGKVKNKATDKEVNITSGILTTYIESRSGEYDEIELLVLCDPYADGYQAAEAGISLKNAHSLYGAYIRSLKPRRLETARLIEKGWNDYHAQRG